MGLCCVRMSLRSIAGVLLVLMIWPLALYAHNGMQAYAVPVEGIVVDGDLRDWPAEIQWYPFGRVGWGVLGGADDFQGSFAIGYNVRENALYVAMDVLDDSIVREIEGPVYPWTQDGFEVFVVAPHEADVVNQWAIWGNERRAKTTMGDADWQHASTELKQVGQRLYGEWKIDIAGLGEGAIQLQSGLQLGVAVAAWDKDEDGSASYISWGDLDVQSVDQIGDLMLVAGPAKGDATAVDPGVVSGRVVTDKGESFAGLILAVDSDNELASSARTDSTGRFLLRLAPGDYLLKPGAKQGVGAFAPRALAIRAGVAQTIDLVVVPPGSLYGRVLTKGAQTPYADLTVLAHLDGYSEGKATTDSAGNYRIHTLPPGEYMAVPRQGGEAYATGPIVVRSGEQSRADLVVDLEPFLAREYLVVPNERMAEFDEVHREKLTPIFDKYGLSPSRKRGRPTPAGYWVRIYEAASALDLERKVDAIVADSALFPTLKDLGEIFGTSRPDGLIDGDMIMYSARAGIGERVRSGPGKTVAAGPGTTTKARGRTVKAGAGRRQGGWQTFDVADGLPSNTVFDVLQDRRGDLWFGTEGGVSRYDGETFTTYTIADGLAHDWVHTLLEDRHGDLWFGTGPWDGSGVGGAASRFDGQFIKTYTKEDGLASGSVEFIFEDRVGDLWFGTWGGGITRYDGEVFTTFTVADGLANDLVGPNAVWQDRAGMLWFGTSYFNPFDAKGLTKYDGESFTIYSKEDGLMRNRTNEILEDREGYLWFGSERGVSRYDGERFEIFNKPDGLPASGVYSMLEDREGNLWFGTDDGLARYDDAQFTPFTSADGLAHGRVGAMLEDLEGSLWFGTGYFGSGGGVSRYDAGQFTTFTTADSLAHDRVYAILQDRQGRLWFGTEGGMTRYNGERFTSLRGEEGMSHNKVTTIVEDDEGGLWFGYGLWVGMIRSGGGVTRYDGESFTTFGKEAGMNGDWVEPILKDDQGRIWIGTDGGVSRYDGEGVRADSMAFINFTADDGLAKGRVWSLLQARNGDLWFGTEGGVSRYDGETFENFTIENGLAHNTVYALLEDREGQLWFGTENGLSYYDGERFESLTTADGLGGDKIYAMLEDDRGHLWFGSLGGGVTQYDGLVFQSLRERDGLADNRVWDLLQDAAGDIWIATGAGVTRYRPHLIPPGIEITNVVAERELGAVKAVRLSTEQKRVRFEFRGRSFKTARDQMAFAYRLAGHDEDWRWTRERSVVYTDLPVGDYQFQVKAVDRDLSYSAEPAIVRLSVHLPYDAIALWGSLGVAVVGLVVATGYGVRRRRDLRRAELEHIRILEEELEMAQKMQMGLMPTEAPVLQGFDLAGRCIPATHVGGDFFQYFVQEGKLSICMADVTGHAMAAAVPVMMFSGILESEIRHGEHLDQLFTNLNHTLLNKLDKRTFVCFAMGALDPVTHLVQLANSGCPYPFHFSADTGTLSEIEVDAYPLGVRSANVYQVIEAKLDSGDYLVFCSDGIIEAADAAEEIFGFEQTAATIRQGCIEGLSADALIDRIIGAVQTFAGAVPQGDDMTCLVLRVI